MKVKDIDLKLYDMGAHMLVNSISDALVAIDDAAAMDLIACYLQVHLAQPASLNKLLNKQTILEFLAHAQMAGLLTNEFDTDTISTITLPIQSFMNPPRITSQLWLSRNSGTVNASCSLGTSADRYTLQQLVDGVYVDVAQGVIADEQVNFSVPNVPGNPAFRVVPAYGLFRGFPGPASNLSD